MKRLAAVLWLALAAACGSSDLKAEGEECVASSECEDGLTCDFIATPPVCRPMQTPVPDAAVPPADADPNAPDADLAAPDAAPGAPDAMPVPDAAPGTPDAMPAPDAMPGTPDAMPVPDAMPAPDASPPDAMPA